ncbi:Pimeloyl-ACP methyl ester carboxylesterase [Halomicrobium zhouii]|uniref:Pimeloyl-ACP methyl ester carboxylesterase n=1 Tax=Halomicrobium zhouii TaxID=767519 RepID=A0A1I6K2W9_9EURY|nr:alpha/beta hydrolase [Halomicrobium zhouii]SFR85569.1 Pimeloyl-ACP methyl ester carboxylesterase [Halomicrobium zhouii]
MPSVDRNGTRLHYDVDGTGPTVAFIGDVGAGAWLWGWQQPALAGPYETLVWDLRGTGRSDAPPGPYDVATLVNDLEAVLSDHSVADVHLVGAGLGGMVALAYAHRYNRANSLTLLGTAANGDAVTDRLSTLRAAPDDPEALRASLDAAFAADLADYPDVVDQITEWRAEDDAALDGWDAQAAAMREFEAPPLYEVTLPSLVMHGVEDVIVPASAGESLAEDLPRGDYQAVEGGHWCFIEESAAVSDALVRWLDEQTDDR